MLGFADMPSRKKIFGIVLSIFFLWLALRGVDLAKLPALISLVRLDFVAILYLSLTVEILTRGWRWKLILGKEHASFYYFVAGWVIGALFNNLFPARAGEFVRSFYLGRRNVVPTAEAFGSVVLERFLDGIVILFLIGTAFSFYAVNSNLKRAGYLAAAFYFGVFLAIVLLLFKQTWFEAILDMLLKPLPENWKNRVKAAQKSFVQGFSLIGKPWAFFRVLAVSFFTWGFSVLSYYLVLQSFSLSMGLKEAVLLISVLSIGAMVPSSPGMIGVFEFCCVVALTEIIGLQRETSVAVGLFIHSLSYLNILLIGVGIMFYENLSFADFEKPQNLDFHPEYSQKNGNFKKE